MQDDHCTEAGAKRLKAKLEAYYQSQGKDYHFWVEPLKYCRHRGRAIYTVRSNIKLDASHG